MNIFQKCRISINSPLNLVLLNNLYTGYETKRN